MQRKILKEIKGAVPMNTWMIKQSSLPADKKVVAVWIEDQTSHNSPISPSLTQSRGLTLFHFMKIEPRKSLKLVEIDSSDLRKEAISITKV